MSTQADTAKPRRGQAPADEAPAPKADAAAGQGNGKAKTKTKGAVRENVEQFAVAIAAALLIRWVVIEPFKIPTGSMAPTLLGKHRSILCPNCHHAFKLDYKYDLVTCVNCGEEVQAHRRRLWKGNRILVWKFIYHLSKPKRWDVMVFKYPRADVRCKTCGRCYDDVPWDELKQCPNCDSTRLKVTKKNFIKRVVGLPGERALIAGGDVYINGRIARKPQRVQNALWLVVYDMDMEPQDPYFVPWVASRGLCQIAQGGVTCAAEPGEPAEVQFSHTVPDSCSYLGGASTTPAVRDLKLSFSVTFAKGTEAIALTIGHDEALYRVVAPADGKGKFVLLKDGHAVQTAPGPRLAAGVPHRLSFAHADAALQLRVDGQQVLRYEYSNDPYDMPRMFMRNRVRMGVVGGKAEFRSVQIHRDIYYEGTSPGIEWAVAGDLELGSDEFFTLGDNSPNSKDARMWRHVPRKNLLGKAFVVFWPPTEMKIIR